MAAGVGLSRGLAAAEGRRWRFSGQGIPRRADCDWTSSKSIDCRMRQSWWCCRRPVRSPLTQLRGRGVRGTTHRRAISERRRPDTDRSGLSALAATTTASSWPSAISSCGAKARYSTSGIRPQDLKLGVAPTSIGCRQPRDAAAELLQPTASRAYPALAARSNGSPAAGRRLPPAQLAGMSVKREPGDAVDVSGVISAALGRTG